MKLAEKQAFINERSSLLNVSVAKNWPYSIIEDNMEKVDPYERAILIPYQPQDMKSYLKDKQHPTATCTLMGWMGSGVYPSVIERDKLISHLHWMMNENHQDAFFDMVAVEGFDSEWKKQVRLDGNRKYRGILRSPPFRAMPCSSQTFQVGMEGIEFAMEPGLNSSKMCVHVWIDPKAVERKPVKQTAATKTNSGKKATKKRRRK